MKMMAFVCRLSYVARNDIIERKWFIKYLLWNFSHSPRSSCCSYNIKNSPPRNSNYILFTHFWYVYTSIIDHTTSHWMDRQSNQMVNKHGTWNQMKEWKNIHEVCSSTTADIQRNKSTAHIEKLIDFFSSIYSHRHFHTLYIAKYCSWVHDMIDSLCRIDEAQ